MKRAWLLSGLLMQGCLCAQLPEGVLFQCEADGACAQPGYQCLDDGLCHAPDGGMEEIDAGVDAGEVDAGLDAGDDDAGIHDAGHDAGELDAGADAGTPDAGEPDAGQPDAGCVPTGAIDEPDPLSLDVDCDGFDGDLSRAVFVDGTNGLDTNVGTRAAPVQTLGEALTRDRSQVYLATGTNTAGALTMRDAVALYGGYDPVLSWSRTVMKSVVQGSLRAAPVDGGRVVLEQLDVRADVGPVGEASVAVTFVSVAPSSYIADCRLAGGTGGAGAPGAAGPSVANGQPGGPADSGTADGGGGVGGAAVACGDAGFSTAGFRGGHGGVAASLGIGERGQDLAAGGDGALAFTCVTPPCMGLEGDVGASATQADSPATPPGAPPPTYLGALDAGVWFAARLPTWAPAGNGRGGGGGGGGGALLNAVSSVIARGGGAGGGGSGGCGARSGEAGQSGGASIALILWASAPTLRNVQLVSGVGGHGGEGGASGLFGAGGVGAVGGAGEAHADGTAGRGGQGGNGGPGGAGRQGPGGWGGPIIGLFCGAGAAPNLDATTTWQAGTPGLHGNGDPDGLAGRQPLTGFSEGCP